MQEQKLERITPAQAGLDPQCIINMMDRMEKEHINITSFMLLRHGKVLCEASYEPYDAAQLRTVYSLSKTFTSMAVGIAAGEGKIDLDEKITDLFAAEIENGKIQVGKELASLSAICFACQQDRRKNQEAAIVGMTWCLHFCVSRFMRCRERYSAIIQLLPICCQHR